MPTALRPEVLSRKMRSESRCYRPRRYYLVAGILTSLFFAVMGVTSTAAAYFNIDGSFPNPRKFAVIFGVFWSAFLLLGIWLILAYFREQLLLSRFRMVYRGVIRTRSVEVADVERLAWNARPIGGSVVVRTTRDKITIYFDNFTKEERETIIHFLRETFPEEIQHNAAEFEEHDRRLASSTKL